MQRTQTLFNLAKKKDVRPAQMALAWLLAQGDHIVPIPGTRRENYLTENILAVDIKLTEEEMNILNAAFAHGTIRGERYTAEVMAGIDK